jgi:5-oxoprolinase (ATP-hydrolysing) subunit A
MTLMMVRVTSHESRVTVIDMNADLGEGAGTDAALLEVITSANIACGVHAGDDATIRQTVTQAHRHGVQIGAHPSFPDREGFGRRPMALPLEQVESIVADQIAALAAAARQAGDGLGHVKAHGALYNLAVDDTELAEAIGRAARRVDPSLVVVALAGTPMVDVFRGLGLRVAQEAFIDRGYTAQGTLVPRDRPGALVTDAARAAHRAVQLAREGTVTAVDGTTVRVAADTLCIHSDSPGAAAMAQDVRDALERTGVAVRRMDTFC